MLEALVEAGHDVAIVDDLAAHLKDRGFPADLMNLGKYGSDHQMYIPWMQATYFMVANKQALPYRFYQTCRMICIRVANIEKRIIAIATHGSVKPS